MYEHMGEFLISYQRVRGIGEGFLKEVFPKVRLETRVTRVHQ